MPSYLDNLIERLDKKEKNPLDSLDSLSSSPSFPSQPELIELIELSAGETDPRMKLLSHSSRTLLHTCPRKFQLYRLSSTQTSLEAQKEIEQEVTFSYGHAVGTGVASVLEGKSKEEVVLDTFLSWNADLLDENPRQKKSFFLALFAVQKFLDMKTNGFLEDYELVTYKGKPAVELAFLVELPGGYKYRGFLDAALKHRTTGEVMVLECKTSSSIAQPATYKNSGQGVGYSVILDKIFPSLSSYTVLYLVYESKSYSYKQLPFEKSLLQRALWLQELLIDTEIISLYESYETYPMHGESCYSFFRDCEYLSLCTLETANLTQPLTQGYLDKVKEDEKDFEFIVSFDELIEQQINKSKEGV